MLNKGIGAEIASEAVPIIEKTDEGIKNACCYGEKSILIPLRAPFFGQFLAILKIQRFYQQKPQGRSMPQVKPETNE